MAGSFRYITRDGYKPYDDHLGVGSTLDNDEDIIEVLKKCYGMIWYLSEQLAHQYFPGVKNPARQTVQQFIHEAEDHSSEGFLRGSSGT